MEINKHGLKRPIPEHVKREVRQRCGFGCVICGNAYIQYDHFDPEFHEATEHNANGITLLCGDHHTRKSAKKISIDTIKRANASPYCIRNGASWDKLDLSPSKIPEIELGSCHARDTPVLLKMNGEDIIFFRPPAFIGGPFRFNLTVKNIKGDTIFQIIDNECVISSNHWDAELRGNTTIIRNEVRDIAVKFHISEGHKIVFDRLKLRYGQNTISFQENGPCIIDIGGRICTFQNMKVNSCGSVFNIRACFS